MIRKFASVSPQEQAPRTRHFSGFPPEVTGGRDHRTELPPARVLVIEESPDGFMLYRYTVDGHCAGDTWHSDLDHAIHQAQHEYADALGEWRPVPENVEDAVVFALAAVSQTP